ncbi:HNH/Endo VII superfamily nuclease toxin with a HHH motif-containing protein [Bacillus sp. OV322]|uniref:hypothetical protein n=1 Tax=Bacillus sp. OV322 TaxID=1882764 RepID=UPI0008ED70AC|nr:hypothetical protein [Bacillus sp. OV322]SFB99322.1 HNH/Endo VII superfamily nuclease toxin with a HHH motif-containing protein [Bacillus sp. OV322]
MAIYRTAKVLNAADHALDAYKTTKGFAALQKTEKGLYALAAANGLGEGITGRDFLGNKLTEEQKQQSLIQAFSILGLGAASKFIGGKPANIPFNTYSKQYAQATAKNAQNTLREIGKQIGKVDVPVGAKVLKMAGNGPIQPKVLAVETKTLSEVKQGLGEKHAKKKEQKQVNKELSGGSKGTGKIDYSDIRAYRYIDIEKVPIEYRADPRLVSEMNYKGKKKSGANAAGWERSASKHFNELLDKHPEFFSEANIERIENGLVPVVDDHFIEHFPQYKDCKDDKLIHHHIGGGGQAAAVPQSLHKGFGGIHNFEKEHKIRDNDPLTKIGEVFTSQKKP